MTIYVGSTAWLLNSFIKGIIMSTIVFQILFPSIIKFLMT